MELPRLGTSPAGRGIYKMYALNGKLLLFIACALAMAIVLHSLVYLSIDAASLSAEVPTR